MSRGDASKVKKKRVETFSIRSVVLLDSAAAGSLAGARSGSPQ